MKKRNESTYTLRWPIRSDVPAVYKVFAQASQHLGGPVFTETIIRAVTSPKTLFVVLADVENEPVGASISRYPTEGVCYHTLFAVRKSLRGLGLGGGMITGILREVLAPEKIGPLVNRFQAHKWFASFPPYNTDVDALYQAMGWAAEGTLKYHTRAKTDLKIRAFYLNEMELPRYWHETHREAPVIEVTALRTPPAKWTDMGALGLTTPLVAQDHDGRLW